MKVLMVDLSGRVLEYDERLWKAMADEMGEEFEFAASMGGENWGGKLIWRLWEFPGMRRWKRSTGFAKHLCKAVEGLVNYAWVWWRLGRRNYDVVHLQWLPFTEFCGLEKAIIPCLQRRAKGAKWVLTQHNIYPHSCRNREAYRKRLCSTAPRFDAVVLHNESAKRDFCREFGMPPERVWSIPFGCHWERDEGLTPEKNGKFRILHFGGLGDYKGSDLLVQAYASLGQDAWEQSELRLAGKASPDFAQKLRSLAGTVPVVFQFGFASQETLKSELESADLVVLPYREIGQSGVLLLAFQFDVDLLVSDLGAFLDTMTDAPPDCFFKTGNVVSLADHLRMKIMRGRGSWLKNQLEKWRKIYRWDTMARKTIALYHEILATGQQLSNKQ